jgi:predicted ATPase
MFHAHHDSSLHTNPLGRALGVREAAEAPVELLTDDLIRACPTVKVLATSREPLRLMAERVVAVPPLAVPDPTRPSSSPAPRRRNPAFGVATPVAIRVPLV